MREIEAILQDAAASGTRIIMSTHDMGQARRLASEVIFMLHGRVHEFTAAAGFFDTAGDAAGAGLSQRRHRGLRRSWR